MGPLTRILLSDRGGVVVLSLLTVAIVCVPCLRRFVLKLVVHSWL